MGRALFGFTRGRWYLLLFLDFHTLCFSLKAKVLKKTCEAVFLIFFVLLGLVIDHPSFRWVYGFFAAVSD